MSILVCGGAGYIGSHCISELKKAGYDCIVYDNLSQGHRAAVDGFHLIEGDLHDSIKLDEVFSNYQIDGVINYAAYAYVGESMKEPIAYYENNVCGMINLLKSMRKANVRNIVFSSTCAVYGDVTDMPITEMTVINPCNPYGQTKRVAEQFLEWCDKAYGIKSVSLRYFNAAGAMPDGSIGEDHALETHLIPLIFKSVLLNDTLHVYGDDYPTKDGSCIRDYVHVLDLADAHIRALHYLLNGGDSVVFNLGSGTGISIFEMINEAEKITGKEIAYKRAKRRLGDPAVLIASNERITRELGWEPVKSRVGMILKDAWLWHSTHPQGYTDKE